MQPGRTAAWRPALALAAWLCCAAHAAPAAMVPLSAGLTAQLGQDSVVVDLRETSAVALAGPITADMLASVRRIGEAGNAMRRVYVDSPGGDVVPAIELARYLRQKKARLVVAGRCFSACANYLFAGAVTKDSLPGSLVGIHGLRYRHAGKERFTEADGGDMAGIRKLAAIDGSVPMQLEAIAAREQAFYRDVGIRTSYHETFRHYDVARQGKPAGPDCPAYALWALSRADLERMGVTGIGTFWTPKDRHDAQAAAGALGLRPADVYFGSEAVLAGMCGAPRGPAHDVLVFLRALWR